MSVCIMTTLLVKNKNIFLRLHKIDILYDFWNSYEYLIHYQVNILSLIEW